MIFEYEDRAAFAEYEAPLSMLERIFRWTGVNVDFFCYVGLLDKKMVKVIHNKMHCCRYVCIEHASPIQAVLAVREAAIW